jgi:sugar O-acyltransferase (sialic acid O-acetyltransferase NeuD family)
MKSARAKVQCVVVLGGRGGGAIAAFTLARIASHRGGQRFLGFLNDTVPRDTRIDGHRVLGRFDEWSGLPAGSVFLAPLHKVREAPARINRVRGLGIPVTRWASVVDPAAVVPDDVAQAPGLFACACAGIMPGTKVGAHVSLRHGSYVGHDATLGDFVFLGANSAVAGYGRIGEGAHVAPGASIREGVSVGRYAVVGLGAVVIRDVPDFAIVAGNPARLVGRIDCEDRSRDPGKPGSAMSG